MNPQEDCDEEAEVTCSLLLFTHIEYVFVVNVMVDDHEHTMIRAFRFDQFLI